MSCQISKKKQNRKYFGKGKEIIKDREVINIALAGNPNVGKSVIFNQLTGLSQTIGNWPGKTVERMEGYCDFLGYRFNIVDLPGIYSLSTFSLEEIVSREYIISDDVDLIINVIDGTNLERNLFFTFQLLELRVPMIIAINQMDILRKRNMDLDFEKLEEIFQLPVMPVVAVHGIGVHQLLEESIELLLYHHSHRHYIKGGMIKHEELSHDYDLRIRRLQEAGKDRSLKIQFQFPDLSSLISFGKEVEEKLKGIEEKLDIIHDSIKDLNYPTRFLAIKILENDNEIKQIIENCENSSEIIEIQELFRKELEDYHGEDIFTIISSEVYNIINTIVRKVIINKPKKNAKRASIADMIDHITTHSFWGYVILFFIMVGTYAFTFAIGDFLGLLIEAVFESWSVEVYSTYGRDTIWVMIFWNGGMGGFFGAVGGVLVYVIPFFLIIEILQDSGYLPRAAFLMDRFMHSLGVHGKTIIPLILGLGCNVPACAGCRIMETEREKKISIALTSMVPCAAVMVVVLGLVGRYLGLGWVIFLLVINFSVLIVIGRILNKTMPGECTELIMEMHEYRVPNYSVITKQTWVRSKEFIFKSLPIIIIIGISLEIMLIFNVLSPLNIVLSPITVFWLGLPIITGVFLIYGILRKELTLILLVILANSLGLTLLELMTPIQMITFCLVTMLYVPCFATIIIIAKQTNWKYAIQISLLEISIALLIGGAIHFGYLFLIINF